MEHRLAHALITLAGTAGLLAPCGCSGGSSGGSAVLRVDASAPPGGDGSSWASAIADLQTALARARSGDSIWVAAGVHKPGPPGASRESTFRLRDGVRLYG